MSDSVVLERFRRQFGVATRAQAMADGLTPRQITRRVRTGTWNRVGPGIYRHPAVDPTWRAELLIACLRLDGLASHRSAAALHGFPGHEPGPIEVTVLRGRRRGVDSIVVHESTAVDKAAPVLIGAIWCTGVARTVLDLAGDISRAELKRTITFVVDTKRASWGDLYSVLVDHCAKGRDGCGPMRSVLEELCGESSLSYTERSSLVGAYLEHTFGHRPVAGYRVHTERGSFLGRVDLALPSYRLAVMLGSIDPNAERRIARAGWTVNTPSWSDYIHARIGSGGEWR